MLLRGLAELVAPTRCAGCELPGELLCPGCVDELPLIVAERACRRCGAPECSRRCPECRDREFAFASAVCAFVFEPPVSRALRLYKDAGERRLAASFAPYLAHAVEAARSRASEDVPVTALCCVPASDSSRRRRGFDHVGLLAAPVAELTGLPLAAALRHTHGGDQRRLGRAGRVENALGAFEPAPGLEHAAGACVLLDDVFTTGATLNAASAALLQAGFAEVHAVALARACRC